MVIVIPKKHQKTSKLHKCLVACMRMQFKNVINVAFKEIISTVVAEMPILLHKATPVISHSSNSLRHWRQEFHAWSRTRKYDAVRVRSFSIIHALNFSSTARWSLRGRPLDCCHLVNCMRMQFRSVINVAFKEIIFTVVAEMSIFLHKATPVIS